MDDTTLNPKTGQNLCENGSRYYVMVRSYKAVAEHLKQKLLNYGVESSCEVLTASFRRLSLDKYRKYFDERISHLSKIFFSPTNVTNKPSKEAYEFVVNNSGVDINKLRVCDIDARGTHSNDYGLVDIGCRHRNHEKKEF